MEHLGKPGLKVRGVYLGRHFTVPLLFVKSCNPLMEFFIANGPTLVGHIYGFEFGTPFL